jgi:hypothetical protein
MNVLSIAVHAKTLPIVYETTVFADIKELRLNRTLGHDMPDSVKFTKYVCSQIRQATACNVFLLFRYLFYKRLQHLPNIVMAVSMEDFDHPTESGALIHLYRPMSSSTLFQVPATPFL